MAELEQEEMSFWDHLEALRWTLFRSFLALFIFAIGSFAFMRGSDGIFDRVVLAPCYSDFIFYRWLCDLNQWLVNVSPWFDVLPDFCNDNFHVDVFNIRLASQFFTHMTTSFWLALVLTFPYLMWEIWKFISPALYENEKKNGYYKLMDNNEIQDFFNKNTRNISWTETWRFLFSYPEGISLIKNIYNNHSNPTQIYTHYLQVIDDAVAAIEYE